MLWQCCQWVPAPPSSSSLQQQEDGQQRQQLQVSKQLKKAVEILGAVDNEDRRVNEPCRPDLSLFRDVDGDGLPVLSP